MAKYKHYDYSQSLLIPVSLQEQLMPGTLEFAIHTLVERRMDMSVFDTRYQNPKTDGQAKLKGKDKGKYSVVAVLHGTQYRESGQLRACIGCTDQISRLNL